MKLFIKRLKIKFESSIVNLYTDVWYNIITLIIKLYKDYWIYKSAIL